MITVGAVIGGPECNFFDSQLMKFMSYCRECRDNAAETAEVNLVYHLPGSIVRPAFVGLRPGKCSTKEKTLMIQIGVEAEWISSLDGEKILRYIYDTADEAIGLAMSEFAKRGIQYDLEADRVFLDNWMATEGFQ